MKSSRLSILVAILCLHLSAVGYVAELPVSEPERVGMSTERLDMVKPVVQKLIDEDKIAGASVIVARRGSVVFFETFGMMDKEGGRAVEEDTIFRFYSMSKPITSVAVMMLFEQGTVKLDDPVSEYLPEFDGQKVYSKGGLEELVRPMTVRDLLRHTSGLTYGVFGNTAVDRMYREKGLLSPDMTLEEMMAKLGKIPLQNQPGSKWHYSVSTDVLGYLVEKVSGLPLDRFFRRRIFRPLDMKDTAFHVPGRKADRFSFCYGPALTVVDDPAKSRYLEKPAFLSGGGGLVSTARDYMRFCQMLLNKGELDGKRLLQPETVEMMTRDQLPEGVSRDGGGGFGLGFSVRREDGEFPRGEYGWGGAASTHFWISPKDDLAVVALSQYMPFTSYLENVVKPLVYDAVIESK